MGPKRLAVGGCAAVVVLLGPTAPAGADDSGDVGRDSTYSSSPDSSGDPLPGGATTVVPPSRQQIDDARDAMQRFNQVDHGKLAVAPGAPREEVSGTGGTSRFAGTDWWMAGAGAFLLLVVAELVRGLRWRVRPRAPSIAA